MKSSVKICLYARDERGVPFRKSFGGPILDTVGRERSQLRGGLYVPKPNGPQNIYRRPLCFLDFRGSRIILPVQSCPYNPAGRWELSGHVDADYSDQKEVR